MSVPKDLEQIKKDIERARAWAERHFNVGGSSTLLDPPACEIDYPEPDQMVVFPVLYGERLGLGVRYRLKWQYGSVGWEGYHILTEKPICWLEILREGG